MTFEKIEPPEHPAVRAARVIKDLHVQNITLIDGGQQFTRDGHLVSDEIRAESVKQIELCDKIIEAADQLTPGSAPIAQAILDDINNTIREANGETPALPEIGNYGHET